VRSANSDDADTQTQEEPLDRATYIFGRPGEFKSDLQMLGTSPRRLLLGVGAASGLGFVANFLGVTDNLVSINPKLSRALRLDRLYAVEGLKGYYTGEYVVNYPNNWLFDQSVAQAQAYRRELRSREGYGFGIEDINSDADEREGFGPKNGAGPVLSTSKVIPDAAFGPVRGGKYENLSVVKQRVLPVKSIEALLGEPRQALERLLSTSIAPEGSGKKYQLLKAVQRPDEEIYEFEYLLTLPTGVRIHTWSAVALKQVPQTSSPPTYSSAGSMGSQPPSYGARAPAGAYSSLASQPELITMTFVAPEDSVDTAKSQLAQRVLAGFRLL